MGESDTLILTQQMHFIAEAIRLDVINKSQIRKIAFLGNPNENAVILTSRSVFPYADISLYDIKLNNWDINSEDWKIEGYDLVVCNRTTPYVEDVKKFGISLKKCLSKNKYNIFDFSLWESQIEGYPAKTERKSPNRNALFDFRKFYNRFTPEESVSSNALNWPPTYKEHYLYHKSEVKNSFSDKDLSRLGIVPDMTWSALNMLTGDCVLTYMLWKKDNLKKSKSIESITNNVGIYEVYLKT